MRLCSAAAVGGHGSLVKILGRGLSHSAISGFDGGHLAARKSLERFARAGRAEGCSIIRLMGEITELAAVIKKISAPRLLAEGTERRRTAASAPSEPERHGRGELVPASPIPRRRRAESHRVRVAVQHSEMNAPLAVPSRFQLQRLHGILSLQEPRDPAAAMLLRPLAASAGLAPTRRGSVVALLPARICGHFGPISTLCAERNAISR